MKTYLTLEVTHSKPIKDLPDLVAGRIWTMDKVTGVDVVLVSKPTKEEEEETESCR